MIRDVRAVLAAYLIPSGTSGRTEPEIFRRFGHIPRDELETELEIMWGEQLVQRFTIDKKRVWRATDKLNA